MKQLISICLLTLVLTSCSLGDDSANKFYTEFLPIESVDMPQEFVMGETYEIGISYFRPSGCHIFYDFYYTSELNQRTVAVVNTVYQNVECQTFEDELVEVSFNFLVTNNGTYVFRFWQGEDENGNDIYFVVEVPVIE